MKIRCVLGVFIAWLAPLAMRAQTWVGGTSGNATNAATNWSPASVPSNGADLVFGASSFFSVGFNTAYAANSLTFSGAYPRYSINTFNNSALSIAGGGITVADTSGGGAGYVDFNSTLPISLTANQTWTTNGNLSVYGTVSGGFALTKAGNGYLVLSGANTHSGGTTVNAGTLYVGQTGSAGTGPLALGSTATLGTSNKDVTVSNAVSLASGATLGGSVFSGGSSKLELSGAVTVGSNAMTLKLAQGTDVSFTGTLTGPASTAITVQNGGLAVLIGSTSNLASFTADGAAIVFANVGALPATSIGAINSGYVSMANLVGGSAPTAPTVAQLLTKITAKPAFDGTLGFDTDKDASTTHTYDLSGIDLSGFTHANFKIGTVTSAVLTGAITTPGQSYNFGGFGDQGGGLFVQSNLGNKNAATTSVAIDSPNSGGVASGGLTVIFQGNNTFTGNLAVTKSGAIFDSATALPSGSNFSLGANSYAGYTEAATGITSFANFASHLLPGYTATSTLGLDSHGPFVDLLTGSTGSAARTVTDNIDLSSFNPIFLGTVAGVTIASGVTIKAPNDGILRLMNMGEKSGGFNVHAPLLEANAHALVAGLPGSNGAINLTAANTFAGGTILQGGGLLLGHNSALGTGAVTVLATTSDKPMLGASVSSVTISNAIAVTDNLTIGTGTFDNSGNFTAGTTTLTLNGVISDIDGSHKGRLYLTGPTVLNGANTYSGGTYVEANTTVNHDGGLGKGFVNVGYNAILTFTTAHPSIGYLADAGQFIGGGGTGTIKLSPSVLDLNLNQTGGGSGTFSGQITGTAGASAAALIKNGTAQLSLLGDNAGQFTGGTTINAGSLAIGDGIVTTVTFGGNVVLAGGSLQFRPGNTQVMSYSGNITGSSGQVNVNGNSGGTVNVTGGNSTFTSNTNVSSGTLRLTADHLWSSASVTTVSSGATLQLDGNQTLKNLVGAGNVVIATAGKTLTVDSVNNTSLTGLISGSGSLAKTGASMLTLSGTSAHTYTGTTTINRGMLKLDFGSLATPTNLISSSSALVLGGGTLNVTGKFTGTSSQTLAGTTINPGASTVAVYSNGGTATNTVLGAISRVAGGTVNFTLPASGTISTSTTATNGLLGGWATVGGTDWANVSAGNIAPASYATGTWASGTNTDVTTTATITAGSTTNSLRFATAGAQTLTLSGTNTLESGGILVTASVGGNTTSITGGTLQGASGQDLVVINHNSSGSLVIASTVADNGAATGLTKSGAGVLTLSSANTYTGPTNLNAGTLTLGHAAALGAAGAALTLNGGTLDVAGISPTTRTGSVGLINGSITGSGTLGKNGGTFDFQSGSAFAVLGGTAGLTKTTVGLFTLGGANTYSGATDVLSGTLLVNGSLLNSAVTVANGAILGGSGTLGAGATFQSGSHLAPGNSPGTITFTNGLTLLTGSILDFQLGTTSDKVFVTGGLLTGPGGTNGVTLNLSNAGGFVAGTYALFDFTGATTSSFDLADFAFGTLPLGTVGDYALSFVGSTLMLTTTAIAVPEPATYAALLGLGALVAAAWRRRRARAGVSMPPSQ